MARSIASIAIGDVVTPHSLPLTSQRLVMIAASNRDFAPIHYDTRIARESGADDAFGNLMFVMTMIEKTLITWAGTGAVLRAVEHMRMTGFNRRGDTVICRGEVTTIDTETGLVGLDVWLETASDRRTATAHAVIELVV